MKKLLAILLFLVSSAAAALEPGMQANGDVVVVIPAAMVKACNENGGCAIVSQTDFMQAVNDTIRENKKEICDYKEAAK